MNSLEAAVVQLYLSFPDVKGTLRRIATRGAIVCSLALSCNPEDLQWHLRTKTHQDSADVTSFVTFDTTQDTEIESETGAISQLDFCLRTGGKRANERKLRSGDWHGDTPAERTAQPKSRRASKKNEAYRCSQRRSRGAISKRQGMDTTGAVRSALLAS
jgi:hypothetical protein